MGLCVVEYSAGLEMAHVYVCVYIILIFIIYDICVWVVGARCTIYDKLAGFSRGCILGM